MVRNQRNGLYPTERLSSMRLFYSIAGVLCMMVVFSACRLEEKFIFHPTSTLPQTPGDMKLTFEDVFFETADKVRLNGWFVPHSKDAPTVLWFHGNGGNIGHRVENIRLLHDKVRSNVFIFDYRGYGRSEGSASELGTYQDAQAALQYLRSRTDIDPNRVVFFGRSLGASVAADLATRAGCTALILESPFVSIREMARVLFAPSRSLVRTKYDTLKKVKRTQCPLLVIHGEQDEVVPMSQGRRVFEAAREPKEFYAIPRAGHNDTYVVGGEAYFLKLKGFIDQATQPYNGNRTAGSRPIQ